MTKQHARVIIQLNMVTCPTHSEKFSRDNAVAPFVLLLVVIVTLPAWMGHKQFTHGGHRALKVLEIFLFCQDLGSP